MEGKKWKMTETLGKSKKLYPKIVVQIRRKYKLVPEDRVIKRLDNIRGLIERFMILLPQTTIISKIKGNQNCRWEMGLNKKCIRKAWYKY